jgi:hypothetical protein
MEHDHLALLRRIIAAATIPATHAAASGRAFLPAHRFTNPAL